MACLVARHSSYTSLRSERVRIFCVLLFSCVNASLSVLVRVSLCVCCCMGVRSLFESLPVYFCAYSWLDVARVLEGVMRVSGWTLDC